MLAIWIMWYVALWVSVCDSHLSAMTLLHPIWQCLIKKVPSNIKADAPKWHIINELDNWIVQIGDITEHAAILEVGPLGMMMNLNLFWSGVSPKSRNYMAPSLI